MEIGHEIFRALGMTLVHSLWQGAVLSVIILFLLGLVKKSNANARYLVLCSGLFLLLAGFVVTFFMVYRYSSFADALHYSLQVDEGRGIFFTPAPVPLYSKFFAILEPWYFPISIFWLVGFLLMGLRIAGGAFLARHKFRKNLVFPDSGLLNLFDKIKEHLNLPHHIKLRISYRMISPLVTGIISPMVIIPSAAITGLSIDQIKAVMVHELAHIRRYDHLVIILQAIAQQVLFFHPVAWLLIPEIERERENCCDDYVINNNNSIIHYVKALAMIQEMNLQNAPVNGLTGKSNQLLNRIKRLIKPEMKHSALFRLTVIVLFIITMSVSALAIIVSDQQNVKNKASENTVTTTIQDDRDGDKKKVKVVFVNDTIREMTVNGKKVSEEEMKEYAEEIERMQEKLAASQSELERMKEQLNEAQLEMEMAMRDLKESEFNRPDFQFELNEEMLQNLDDSRIKLEEFKHLWENGEFNQEMEKTLEDALKTRKDAFKSREDAMKSMEQARKVQKEYWDKHRNEFKMQWELNHDEYKMEWEKAREEFEKAIEELKKNGTLNENFDFHFNLAPDVPVVPRVPDIKVAPPVPHIEMTPPVPHIEMTPPVPHIEMTPPVPHRAPVAPGIEIPKTPEVSVHEDDSDTPAKDASIKESLDEKLRELEEED